MNQSKTITHEELRRRNPHITSQQLARADAITEESMKDFPVEAMLDDMIPVYQKHLTKLDVDAMTTFYSSPTGQKLLREMPAMTSESMQAAYGRLQKHMEAMRERVNKILKEPPKQNPPKPQPKPESQQKGRPSGTVNSASQG